MFWIRKINTENNTTLFLVEQNADHALKVAHRGYIMGNGCIALSHRSGQLMDDEEIRRA